MKITTKKGFLFVITIFLILTYILTSISVWVKSVEASERVYSEFYKESTVELAIIQLTPEKMGELSQKIMYRALFRVNEESMTNEVRAGSGEDEYEYIEAALEELFVNGSASHDYFELDKGLEEENSSMSKWASNMNASLLAIGIYIDEFKIYNFKISQSVPNKVNYSFNMNLSMRDVSGNTRLNRTYFIHENLTINGLVDPAIVRETNRSTDGDQVAYRMFFFNDDYETPSDLSIDGITGYDSIHGGQGWFYGYVRETSDISEIEDYEKKKYILVGSYDDIIDADPFEQFGAYIVTNDPYAGSEGSCAGSGSSTYRNQRDTFIALTYEEPDCDVDFDDSTYISIPFIEAEDFSLDAVPSCPKLYPAGSADERCLLFVNPSSVDDVLSDPGDKTASGSGIYDIEDIRDFIMCGYYTHNEDAPSYLQRLFENSYDRSHEEFGIETFVIGEYANSTDYEGLSRLDRNLLQGIGGRAVRGMPGCRQYEHCSGSPSTGVFTIDSDSVSDSVYDVADAYCSGVEGCEE